MGFQVLLGSLNNTNASNYKTTQREGCVAHTHPLRHKRHVKWCATVSAPPSIIYRFLPVRPKQKMISVVRAYEGDVLDGGQAPPLKSVVPRTSGLNDILVFQVLVKVIDMFKYDFSLDLKMVFYVPFQTICQLFGVLEHVDLAMVFLGAARVLQQLIWKWFSRCCQDQEN